MLWGYSCKVAEMISYYGQYPNHDVFGAKRYLLRLIFAIL